MQTIIASTPALVESTPALDNWSQRFDAAQLRYRASQCKPVARFSEATLAAIRDAESRAIAADLDQRIADGAARLEASRRRLEETEAMLAVAAAEMSEESFADELVAAVAVQVRDESDIPASEDDPAWDEAWTTEAPRAPLTPKELLTPYTIYPLNHPARRADADDVARAWEIGYQLGSDGFTVRNVGPCSNWTAAECNAFVEGIISGESRLWDDVARDREELDRMADVYDPYRDVNEAELIMSGSAVGH